MKAKKIEVRNAIGQVLSSATFRSDGEALMAKGDILNEQDIRILQAERIEEVWVVELDEDEISGDQAVCIVAGELACGPYEIHLTSTGRADLIADQDCCVLVEDDLLRQVNDNSSVVIATTTNFTFALTGQRIATVNSAPFAIPTTTFEQLLSLLRDCGPIMQVRPVAGASVAVLYCDPIIGDRARTLFESAIWQRLEYFGINEHHVITVLETENQVSRGLQKLLRTGPSVILVASTTTYAGPGDVVGRAMHRIGCLIERFLAPVEPGGLLLIGYKDDVPVVSAPGCLQSTKPSVLDVILPPLLARYRVSTREISRLGHGGLLA